MKIILTEHAKERMVLRGITEEMIKKAMLKPDKIGVGYEGKNLVFKKFSNGIIKVIFIKKKNFEIIISVIWELKK